MTCLAEKIQITVKLGYNELGYYELSVITNSRLLRTKNNDWLVQVSFLQLFPVIVNKTRL